jgi:flagellar motor switch protein FliN/FliY
MSDMSEAPGADARAKAVEFSGPNYDLLSSVSLRLSVEAGSTSMPLAELLALNAGSVVQLNRQAGELLDVMVNGTPIAKGEIVTVDGRYGIRIVEVASTSQRAAGLERR